MEYGAIDLHARYSQIRIIDEEGRVQVDRRIPTSVQSLRGVFAGRPRMRLLLETGTDREWVAQALETCGHDVIVADPNYALMYGQRSRRVKTDKRDVAALAEACRVGVYRRAHRVSAPQRDARRRLAIRRQLVRVRTQAINVLRAQLRQEGYRLGSGAAETAVARYTRLVLPAALTEALRPVIGLLTDIAPAIATADEQAERAAATDPVTRRLMTAPGIGPITALTFRATVDDIGRLRDASSASAFVGLVPRENSSGERQRRGRITKTGPTALRSLLIQAAWVVWRTREGRGTLAAWGHAIAARRGRRIAVVALARRLTRILYAMWRDGTEYRLEPSASRVR